MKYSNIRVLVGRSVKAVDDGQCDDVKECDTIKEAKEFARHSLTEAYQRSGEFSEPMNYARVAADEDGQRICVADYFRKGYVEPVEKDDEDLVPGFAAVSTGALADGDVCGVQHDGKPFEFLGPISPENIGRDISTFSPVWRFFRAAHALAN